MRRGRAEVRSGGRLRLCPSQVAANSNLAASRIGRGSRGRPVPALAQRKRLYASAPLELKRLIRAVALTAARPGEIAHARVSDIHSGAGTLALSGKTGRRVVPLSPAAVPFFKACAEGEQPEVALVRRKNGAAWHRFAWRDAMQVAVTTAKLPGDVVLYSIRHAAISEMLTAGLDPMSVARLAGRSVTMISKHYGHLVHDHLREKVARVKVL